MHQMKAYSAYFLNNLLSFLEQSRESHNKHSTKKRGTPKCYHIHPKKLFQRCHTTRQFENKWEWLILLFAHSIITRQIYRNCNISLEVKDLILQEPLAHQIKMDKKEMGRVMWFFNITKRRIKWEETKIIMLNSNRFELYWELNSVFCCLKHCLALESMQSSCPEN